MSPPKLTISMATYDDYDGVFFTIQSLRMYHNTQGVEFLVMDNNPTSAHGAALREFLSHIPNSKYVEVTDRQSSWVKYDAFKYATGEIVLGLDCHLLLAPGFIAFLLNFFNDRPESRDMLTGPIIFNDLRAISSHLKPEWNGHDFGTWANCPEEKGDDPFEIPMQGMGCFALRREAWYPICDSFKGFGSEEWYMAEHVRRGGGKVICHPKLVWHHRFSWPARKFPLSMELKIHNYYAGWMHLYKTLGHPNMRQMTEHWLTQTTLEKLRSIVGEITREPLP